MKAGDKVGRMLCVSGYLVRDPEGYLKKHGIKYQRFLGYNSICERYEFIVDDFPKGELPKYVYKIEYESR